MIPTNPANRANLVEVARSWLFVPGDRPERFGKAVAAGADMVILDLEDAVAAAAKDSARRHVRDWLSAGGTAAVRINAAGTPWHAEDLAAVLPFDPVIVVPKAQSPAVLATIGADARVVALVETALGIENALSLAGTDGVLRLALGHVDLAAELGVNPDHDDAFGYARSKLVMASAAAGIAPPIDGVTTSLDDPVALAADVARARRSGFTGKLCIHPRQISDVHAAFAPDPAEIDYARRVVAAAGDTGAVALDGRMVDRPVLLRAQRILRVADHPA